MDTLLTNSTIAMLLLEGIKYLVRLVLGNPDFDFAPGFYSVVLPVLEVLVAPIMVWLGLSPDVGLDWSLQSLIVVLLEALASVLIYNNTLKPLKEYAKAYVRAK